MPKLDNSKLHLYNCYFDINKFNLAYESYNEYLDELGYLVDSYVNALFRIRKSNSREEAKYLGLRGIVITDNEVDNVVMSSMIDKRNVKTGEDIRQSLIICFEHISNRVALSIGKINFPLENFWVKHKCSFALKLAMIFSLMSEVNRKYERLFGYLQDDNSLKNPTLGLIYSCVRITEDIELNEVIELLDMKLTMIIFDNINSYELPCFISKSLKLKKLAVDFFMDNKKSSFSLTMICKTFNPDEDVENIIINTDIDDKLRFGVEKILENNLKRNIVHLYGPNGSGKKLHIKHLAKVLNKKILFVDLKYIFHYESVRAVMMLSNVYLYAYLHDGLICYYNCDFDDEFNGSLEFILNDTLRLFELIFILNEKPKFIDDPTNLYMPIISIKIDMPSISESVQVWEYLSKKYKFNSDIDFKQISNKFRYTPGQISEILKNSSIEASTENSKAILEETLIKECREHAVHDLDKRATLINCHYTFDDLVIDEDQKKILMSACNYIKYKDIVYEDWGFINKVPYGRGLSVLLYGPPGTGKTMGAQVMANELGLQLYKIDLSQIINKYIGETEKNLGSIFDEAKKSNAILLFDEADSLFGKRTDVKDSNDKNSNNETSFLLQKIEEYEGVSILTTNKFNNFDEAFRRRIRFTVSFPMPDMAMRRTLWKKIFPSTAPLGNDFDDMFLAEKFELSGSSIKSIAILAAYMAVADKSTINMKHILTALRYENQKMGKIISKQDLGIYGELL